jgi:hypothetical protein
MRGQGLSGRFRLEEYRKSVNGVRHQAPLRTEGVLQNSKSRSSRFDEGRRRATTLNISFEEA